MNNPVLDTVRNLISTVPQKVIGWGMGRALLENFEGVPVILNLIWLIY